MSIEKDTYWESIVNTVYKMQQENIIILGIESSCDDTSASVIKNGKILSNVIAQQAIHEQYGGVVPELASRAHQQNIIPVVDAAIKQAGITKEELKDGRTSWYNQRRINFNN